jgi:lysophospholipase L1-like esterase
MACGWLLFGITAITAAYFAVVAQWLFEQYETLKLEPTYAGRFAAANATHTWTARRRIIIFGDSRVAQWDPIPTAPNAQVVLRGVGRETIAQMRYRFESDVLTLKPNIVIIQAGINDLVAGVSVPTTGADIPDRTFSILRSFIEQSRSAGIQVIIATVVRPGPVPFWRRFFWSDSVVNDVERFNGYIRRLAGDGIKILDADKLLINERQSVVEAYSADTLHFTKSGYQKLDEALMTIMEDK